VVLRGGLLGAGSLLGAGIIGDFWEGVGEGVGSILGGRRGGRDDDDDDDWRRRRDQQVDATSAEGKTEEVPVAETPVPQ